MEKYCVVNSGGNIIKVKKYVNEKQYNAEMSIMHSQFETEKQAIKEAKRLSGKFGYSFIQ